MKIYTFLSILFFSILTVACDNERQTSYKNFEYESLTDKYNSQTNVFTRKYNDGDSLSVKIKLSDDEKITILNRFYDNNFLKLSKEIDCSSWGVQPQIYTSISLWNKRQSEVYF